MTAEPPFPPPYSQPPAAPPVTPAPSSGQPPPPAETDKVSVTAFVLSLFGIGIAAVPLGIWGIVRTSGGARRGRGFAVGALVVSVVWGVVATVAVVGLLRSGVVEQLEAVASSAVASATSPPATEGGTAEPGEPAAGSESVYWQDLEPGMCFTVPAGEEFDVTVVDCREEHEEEVIASTTLDGDGNWPGDAAVETAAQAACVTAFNAYVGLDYDSSRLDTNFYTTEQEGWEGGNRRLICMVYDPDQELVTQSFKGSKE